MSKTEREDPREIFQYALERHPEKVSIQPLGEVLRSLARKTDTKPARLELAFEDEHVKNLKGAPEKRDLWLLLRIPREVIDRSKSRIVLPGEVRVSR